MPIRDLLRQDRRVRKLKRLIKSGNYSLPIIEWQRELEAMYSTRLTRRLTVGDVVRRFHRNFMQAVLQNQSNRSRAVEIKVHCVKTRNRLRKHTTELKRFLLARYSVQLRPIRTKAEREDMLNSVLFEADDCRQELDSLIEIIDLMVADMDSTGRTVYNLVEMMKLLEQKGKQY